MRVRRFQVPCAATLCLLARMASGTPSLELSPISDVVTTEDTPTPVVRFTVDNRLSERSAALLVRSSNPTLIPEANVRFGQLDNAGTLVITPAPNQSGRATVQLHATDGSLTVTQSFAVFVKPINDAPTISRVGDQTLGDTRPTGPLTFTIGDVETPAASLTVSAASSDPALLPGGSILLAGTGATRSLTLRPAAGKSGLATVTLKVSDGDASTSQDFQLMVGTVNRAPLANAGADQTVVGTNATVLNGTATDDSSTDARLLTIWTLLSGPADVSLTDPTALNTAVYFRSPGVYTLRLTASDGNLSGSDDVTIVVAAAQFARVQGTTPKRR